MVCFLFSLRKRLVEAVVARAQRLETAGRSNQSLVLLGKALVADPDIQNSATAKLHHNANTSIHVTLGTTPRTGPPGAPPLSALRIQVSCFWVRDSRNP